MLKTNKIIFFSILFLTLLIQILPFGIFLYPINLFTTFIHESGHALAAILTGNKVISMVVYPNGSGLTVSMSSGYLSKIIITFSGYIATTLFGAFILLGTDSKKTLKMTSIFLLLSVLFFTFFTKDWFAFNASTGIGAKLFSLFVGIFLVIAFWFASYIKNIFIQNCLVLFLGFQCILNSFRDIKTVFGLSVIQYGQNDAIHLQELTHIPAVLWASIWAILSIIIVIIVFKQKMIEEK